MSKNRGVQSSKLLMVKWFIHVFCKRFAKLRNLVFRSSFHLNEPPPWNLRHNTRYPYRSVGRQRVAPSHIPMLFDHHIMISKMSSICKSLSKSLLMYGLFCSVPSQPFVFIWPSAKSLFKLLHSDGLSFQLQILCNYIKYYCVHLLFNPTFMCIKYT